MSSLAFSFFITESLSALRLFIPILNSQSCNYTPSSRYHPTPLCPSSYHCVVLLLTPAWCLILSSSLPIFFFFLQTSLTSLLLPSHCTNLSFIHPSNHPSMHPSSATSLTSTVSPLFHLLKSFSSRLDWRLVNSERSAPPYTYHPSSLCCLILFLPSNSHWP